MRPRLIAIAAAFAAFTAQAQPDGFIFQPITSGHTLPTTQRDNHASTLVGKTVTPATEIAITAGKAVTIEVTKR